MAAMWLYLIGGFLLLVGIVGSVFSGGIFTIVLLPIGAIVFVSGVLYGMWARAQQGSAGGSTEATEAPDRPLPHHHPRPSGRAPTSPERLADARRAQQ
jgi:hypothetical protein